jgi:hypothetical protein
VPTNLIRDLKGNPVGFIDGETLRDSNGKTVANGAADEPRLVQLSNQASAWMSGKVLLDLAIGDVLTPATQDDVGIPAGECVADIASKVRFVKHDRGYWYGESVQDAVQLPAMSGAALGQPVEINPLYAKTAFTTSEYSLAVRLPRPLLTNADFDLKKRALRRLVEGLRLAREVRVATLLTAAASYASTNQIASTASSIADMFSALAASFLPANSVILPENAGQYFYSGSITGAPNMRDYVQSGGEMPKVVFARQKYLHAGAGGIPTYVWAPSRPANVAFIRAVNDVETDIPTSLTYRWLGDAKDGDRRDGVLVREFWAQNDDAYWLVVVHNDAEVMMSNQVGAVVTSALT